VTEHREGGRRRAPVLTLVFAVLVIGGLVLGGLLRGPPPDGTAVEGGRAPDFTVELIDGGAFTLSDRIVVDGPRAIVVNLWASWCIPCRTEIPEISAFADANADVVVIGVAVQDSEQASRSFAAEIGATYPLALGNAAFSDSYPWLGLPTTFIIDGEGVVRKVHNGIVDADDLEELTAGL
jgi:cytochrome c biogenesis protein CcmG, thiol:disulfide interchange protein DsbE